MAVKRVSRRLAAVLAADVVGYSRLVGMDEEGTIGRLKALREQVIDPCIAKYDGRIVKTTGDGVLVEFPSVIDAVRSAVEVQQAVLEREADEPEDRRLAFRIGVNLGDIVIDGEDILGDGVNVAARLEGLAEPNGVCISAKVYEEVQDRLEIAFEDSGLHKVKNIAKPLHVWRWSRVSPTSGRSPAAPTLDIPDKPSIAVLPFQNMSGDPEQEFFSDGITEDIITELSRLRWLFVISRNSSFTYKGKVVEVKRIAEELGVRYVLEGSVRKAGNKVRITAQLIDASADRHLWAHRFDRDLEDIFELQDEIASQITSTVNVEIDDTEQERASRQPTEDLDAWELYQRGMRHVWRQTRDDHAKADRLFNKAIERDATFAPPYAGRAYIGALDVMFGYSESPSETLSRALDAGLKAVELDDRDAFAHFALGRLYIPLGNRDAAIAEAEKAVRLSPSFALAHYGLGLSLFWFGRAAAAVPRIDMAIRLSPRDPALWAFHTIRGWCFFQLGDHASAEISVRKAFQENPKEFWPHLALASVLAQQGRIDEARDVCAKLSRLKPEISVSTFRRLLTHMDSEYRERMADALRKAGLPD